ncbi:Ulp1-like peptidase [Cucumis melo var. makuwa]|uniref:Ulp1-like peptidase n=1 Tax=Cucumis melo var. makuwa TaxID=1194695 RepID=A0A5A7U4Y5_CUCMM|nr:Ulp1-like peptidase [Cucumis melo var. makuwa]
MTSTSISTDGPLYKINPSHHFYSLVEDEGKDSISFFLGGVVCTFGRREFNIITGLWGPKEDYIQLVGNSRLLEKFFKDKECVYVSDLEDIFLEYEGDDDDIVKLALVYFIEISLLGKDRRTKVDIGLGIESIPTIIGCGVDKVNDHAIPRMLRWVCQQSPKSQTISQVFDSPMFIIKAVIEMTPEEEQLKIASGELFENFRSSTIIQSKNGGSKRVREVVNDEDDFKKSKKQKSKIKMKNAIRNLQDRVAVVEGQLNSIKSDIDELKGMMSTILKYIGLQRKVRNETIKDHKVSEGLVDHTLESKDVDNTKTEDVDTGGTPNWLRMPKEDEHIEVKKKGDEDVLEKKVDIGLEEPIDVIDDEDVTEIEPFLTQRHTFGPPVGSVQVFTYQPHSQLYLNDRLRAWITDKRTDDKLRETFHGKKSKAFFRDLFMCRRWLSDEHLDALFLFIRLKIKAAGIPSSQNFTTADTIFMRILVSKWSLYKECIKENRPFDWDEEYRLVDYVVGSKEDFQDPWASVDYVYSPFNVHGNHWVLLCLDLVSCQVKVWDSLPSLTTAEEMTNILLPIRQLVPKLLDSTGFFDRRGRSSTYKKPWPVVIVDSIPLQRNNSDCGVFTIKYFEYIAAGVGLDTLCQENMSYFKKQLAFQLWTNTPMY